MPTDVASYKPKSNLQKRLSLISRDCLYICIHDWHYVEMCPSSGLMTQVTTIYIGTRSSSSLLKVLAVCPSPPLP